MSTLQKQYENTAQLKQLLQHKLHAVPLGGVVEITYANTRKLYMLRIIPYEACRFANLETGYVLSFLPPLPWTIQGVEVLPKLTVVNQQITQE